VIETIFKTARTQERMALMPYVMAGYPNLTRSMEHLRAIVDAGADMIELGIPFSDPVADGPAIQHAAHEALRSGVTLRKVLDTVERHFPEIPVVLMSYLNPLLAVGRAPLLDRLSGIGFAGLIVPDLPLEECDAWRSATDRAGLSLVPLVAPTTRADRRKRILRDARGFVYYVSVAGTTGTRRTLSPMLAPALDRLRSETPLPVAAGFGISTADHVTALYGHADGIVVGSRIVEAIRNNEDVGAVVTTLKHATGGMTC